MTKRLLSFSIDLCNSTKAKDIINSIAGKNTERAADLLHKYYDILLSIEKHLYQQCINYKIPLSGLFFVKAIGDELWYVWEVKRGTKEDAIKEMSAKLLDTLLAVASRRYYLSVTAKDVKWEQEEKEGIKAWEGVQRQNLPMPVKVYIDLLSDYECFNQWRHEAVFSVLNTQSEEYPPNRRSQWLKEQLQSVAIPLGLDMTENTANPTRAFFRSRFDPIGLDVDRFFRCAKLSQPGIVTIGEDLFNSVLHSKSRTECELDIQIGEQGKQFRHLNCIRQAVPKKARKGISSACFVYHIIDSCYAPQLTTDFKGTSNDGCDSTRALLQKRKFIKLKTTSQKYDQYDICRNRWTLYGKQG